MKSQLVHIVDEEPKRGAVPNQQKVIEHFTSPGVHDWATTHGKT